MPVLQLRDQQFTLPAGPSRVGAGSDADITLPADPSLGVQAVIDGPKGQRLAIRRATDAAQVRVNGVLLGAEPVPLMHGDKVEIGGLELRYADDNKGGATQFVSAGDIAAMAGAKRSGAARATTASGGRLVSLVDGKEYTVADAGLVLGRDASCDVVVAQHEVSRRHAEIAADEQGYLVRDTSANGVFVNGEKVQGSQRLARADVIRVGSEEFRFYADVARASTAAGGSTPPAPAPTPVTPPAPAAPAAPAAAAVPAAPPVAAPVPHVPVAPVPVNVPAAPPAAAAAPPPVVAPAVVAPPTPLATPVAEDPRPVLATLESLNEGPDKGKRYALRTPLAHIGRGAHNDIRLDDESVSETHAKLQKREDGWYVVDMQSTNGTYVGGARIPNERRLDGSPDVRFGGMKMRFTGHDSAAETEAKGTRAIAAIQPKPRPSFTPISSPTLEPATPTAASPKSEAPVVATPAAVPAGKLPAWIWIVVALVVVAGVLFFLKGRA